MNSNISKGPKIKVIRICTVPIFFNIIYRNQFKFLLKNFRVIGVSGPDKKHFYEIQKREGLAMKAISIERKISLVNDIAALFKLFFLFRREKPEIVHTHTPKGGLLGVLAAFLARVPIRIHTIEGIPFMGTKGIKRKILFFFEKATYDLATDLLSNSVGLMDFCIDSGLCKEKKIKVLGNGSSNGVDHEYFDPSLPQLSKDNLSSIKKNLDIKEDAIVFTFVGRIGIDKGIRELLSAFKRIYENDPRVILLLVGPFENTNGVLAEEDIELIQTHQNIRFVGRHDDIRPYLALADVFVFPSYREGFPNAVLEACAMGLPCIVTNINGCNEIVSNNVNGLLIEPRNDKALEKAMTLLVNDDNLRTILASNSRTLIVDKFRRKVIWEELEREYNFLLKKNKNEY